MQRLTRGQHTREMGSLRQATMISEQLAVDSRIVVCIRRPQMFIVLKHIADGMVQPIINIQLKIAQIITVTPPSSLPSQVKSYHLL